MKAWGGMGMLLWMTVCHGAWAATVTFDLSDAVDADIVYEGGPGTQTFGQNPFATQTFAADGYSDGSTTADGLPASQQLESTYSGLGSYQLLPYDGNNAIELYTHSSGPYESHEIDVPDFTYLTIGLLVSAVEGDASFTIKLNYLDGTVTRWWEADDWYDDGGNVRPNEHVVIGEMDRVNVNTGQVEDSNHFSLFEFLLTPDTNRVLTSITIGNDPNRWPDDQQRWAAIFAMNGEVADVVPEPSTFIFFGLGAGLFYWQRRLLFGKHRPKKA